MFYKDIQTDLVNQGYSFERIDFERPWGGFLVIHQTHKKKFVEQYFSSIPLETNIKDYEISPKILMVAPNKRLSWQYHRRRSELWQVVSGQVGIVRSDTDEEGSMEIYNPGDQVRLLKGERHRLVGLQDWGVVAEIWIHEDADHPSDENDIVRLQDDFERTSPVQQ